jgi:hypothetical protein
MTLQGFLRLLRYKNMTMEKLELKHLAIHAGGKVDLVRKGFEIYNVDLKYCQINYNAALKFYYLKHKSVTYGLEDITPYRRPLSDLTKEIEVNHEKFVPIIELARISEGNYDDGEFFKSELLNPKAITREASGNNAAYICQYTGLSDSHRLLLNFNDGFHSYYHFRDDMSDVSLRLTDNQKLLWEKLYEWHFDVSGLIEKGLAIDINTISHE